MSKILNALISHIGICTSNVELSVRFYSQALGFVHERSLKDLGPPYDALTELPGITFCAHHLTCGDVTLELIGYAEGEVVGSNERRAMNQLGFTHMTLIVDDVEAAAARVVEFGGKAHRETRIDSPFGPMIFCTDPDGVRIELIQRAD
jgi:predicted enzyme related to lactoylglutathione lyase